MNGMSLRQLPGDQIDLVQNKRLIFILPKRLKKSGSGRRGGQEADHRSDRQRPGANWSHQQGCLLPSNPDCVDLW